MEKEIKVGKNILVSVVNKLFMTLQVIASREILKEREWVGIVKKCSTIQNVFCEIGGICVSISTLHKTILPIVVAKFLWLLSCEIMCDTALLIKSTCLLKVKTSYCAGGIQSLLPIGE